MRKQLACLVAAILMSAAVLHAQDTGEAPPFLALDNELKTATHRWAGDKESLSKIFDAERRRLGPRFERELPKWLGNNLEKHYWISFFLEAESYLHGNKRLPELSLLIKQQGLTLVEGKGDYDSKGYVVGLSITAAILSDELGLQALARFYKQEAEGLLMAEPGLAGYIPARSTVDQLRYNEIPSTPRPGVTVFSTESPEVPGDTDRPPHAPITGGILNGKALKLPKPRFPKEAREAGASGTVQVRVVIDETGKVIYARAISGHETLRKVSEEAASQSEFSPTKLAGVPVKVSGVIQYNFVSR